MSRYHYDDEQVDSAIAREYKEERDRVAAVLKKQSSCKHPRATASSPMGFGECPDCHAIF